MRLRSKGYPRGFALIEVLIYVGIIGALLSASATLVSFANHARAKQTVEREVEEQGRHILEYVLRTARQSTGIVSPAMSTSGTSLSLSVESPSASPTIISLSGNTLYGTEGAASAVSLTNTRVLVTDFLVENLMRTDTAGSVRVSFTLSGTSVGGSQSFVYSQTFYGTASLR
jgi:type II secretory pathway pseudopilin PulG